MHAVIAWLELDFLLLNCTATTMENQRMRAMEALERRFAQAKNEIETQQQKSKKRLIQDTAIESSPTSSKVKKPSIDSPSRKGNISFLGKSGKQEVELNEPAYLKLYHPVDGNLLKAGAEVVDRKGTVNQILHELLQHGDSAQKYIQGSKSLKIENTILLDNFVQRSGMFGKGRAEASLRAAKRSKKHMSLKQHKRSGLFDLPQEFHDYEIYKPMHEKWKSYMLQLLKIVGKDQLSQCFLNADLHGAIVLVVQCKIATYRGVHGIMIGETKETLGIITQDNKFRVVPKKYSVFILQADCWKITLYGDKLASRNWVP